MLDALGGLMIPVAIIAFIVWAIRKANKKKQVVKDALKKLDFIPTYSTVEQSYPAIAFNQDQKKAAFIFEDGSIKAYNFSDFRNWTLNWNEKRKGDWGNEMIHSNIILTFEMNDMSRPVIKCVFGRLPDAEDCKARVNLMVNG